MRPARVSTFVLNPARLDRRTTDRGVVQETRAELFSHFQLLETWWDVLMLALRTVFGGATIPLLWLAVAGLIYGVMDPQGLAERRPTSRR